MDRFKEAQDRAHLGFRSALDEIRTGAKRGHWIWYIFPQLSGMGISENSQYFGIDGEEEATEFLRDPELRSRLLTITAALARRLEEGSRSSLGTLMGSRIDAQKVVSSLTLFGHIARQLQATDGLDEYGALADEAGQVLAAAASEGFAPCAYTLQRLREQA